MPFLKSAELTLETGSHVDSMAQEDTEGETPPPRLAEGHSPGQQEVINLAWEVSNQDVRFLYLLTAENGEYSYQRTHPNHANTVGTDHGLCGVNDYFHPNITNDPRFKTDIKWQMDQCYKLYQGGTTFYGIIRYDRNANFKQKIHNKFQ
jgi:hypothetical protein